jgi:putative acetyltransferase
MKIERTNSNNKDFLELLKELDKFLIETFKEEMDFFGQFNYVENIKYVILIYDEDKAVGCGCIKEYSNDTMEIKRMFTSPEVRNKGVASKILKELENWALELGCKRLILETGDKLINAQNLYKKNNFKLIENYDQYKGVESSVCFEKLLNINNFD